ncbi:glucose 1,6-bisphosphate synthase [Drosophila mojavensis]|uniref:Uncharacterized protein n=1 Tax=Drosophila mojavensis TaxID=7230 RepID=B4KQJ0_DROMO|nr:glucose 1,6-bisphosphate synthase [Drosophila mojavensis]XP_043866556.1 glucose 1,6-bisphosphate synthase [Drosophila mojavensis]EDW08159.1 uncharacterized protein Dmoj_GI19724 [Drosophila mojavensis]
MDQGQNESANRYSGNEKLDKCIHDWLSWDPNPTTKNEIQKYVDNEDWETLKLRLCKRISFGTAGLRAEMRAGFDSMNDLVVIQTAQGICEYLKKQFPEKSWSEQGIVFGYDARHNSKRFAQLSALVFLENGFRVYLYTCFVATPIVPFSIKKLKCLAGVQVTASHNRKEDNGYKVYWSNGAQIIPPHDSEIQKAIEKNLKPLIKKDNLVWKDDGSVDDKALWSKKQLQDPYDQVVPAYFEELINQIPKELIQANQDCPLKFAYTAMQGVGYEFVKKAIKYVNLEPLIPVEEQVEPDPDFRKTPMPNPEEAKALELAEKTAINNKCQIILANDPDADRLAVAEVYDNEVKIFTGNEIGALLGWWALEIMKISKSKVDTNHVMIASTVSSKILKSMAQIEGFTFHETLTGFKWMANKAIDEELTGKTVLFAFEEAIGFMISTVVPDKDGVSAAAHVATMARYLYCEKKLTLQQQLESIYRLYGYHTSICSYVICDDQVKIKQIFNRLRTFDNGQANSYPKSILNGKYQIEHVRDLTTGYDSSTADLKATLPVSSSSQMITFTFANNVVVTLRTSGTEPKMKYYAEICGDRENSNWEQLTVTLKIMVEALVNEFFEPEKNKLKLKSAV